MLLALFSKILRVVTDFMSSCSLSSKRFGDAPLLISAKVATPFVAIAPGAKWSQLVGIPLFADGITFGHAECCHTEVAVGASEEPTIHTGPDE